MEMLHHKILESLELKMRTNVGARAEDGPTWTRLILHTIQKIYERQFHHTRKPLSRLITLMQLKESHKPKHRAKPDASTIIHILYSLILARRNSL